MKDRGLGLPPELAQAAHEGGVSLIVEPITKPIVYGLVQHGEEWLQLNPDGVPIGDIQRRVRCPFAVGQRLYVKEACERYFSPNILTGEPTNCESARYCADKAPCLNEHGFDYCPWWAGRSKCPASRMPAWAARTWLTVTVVEARRVCEITADEARRSGFNPYLSFFEHWNKRHGRRYPWETAWAWFVGVKRDG